MYGVLPDHEIGLTPKGKAEATRAGRALARVVRGDPVYFIVSPYRRTRDTFSAILASLRLPPSQFLGAREAPEVREVSRGRFQPVDRSPALLAVREAVGSFFYKFPSGESPADALARVAAGIGGAIRGLAARGAPPEAHLCVVTHGAAIRVALAALFSLRTQAVEAMAPPRGGEVIPLLRSGDGARVLLSARHRRLLGIPAAAQGVGAR